MHATLATLVGLVIGATVAAPILAEGPRTTSGGGTAAADARESRSDLGAPSPGADRTQRSAPSTDATHLSPHASDGTQIAVFAAGCFWCSELAFEQLRGVLDVETGYCGGTRKTATYDRVHRGTTRHAESIRVTYDSRKIRYEQLLDVFFDAHDPTQLNRQGEDDVGRQYRSAIFFANDEQKKAAEAKIDALRRQKAYARRIVTRLEPLETFYPAEDVHQDFARKNPLLPYIQSHAIPKACNAWMKHPELLDQGR